jgi:hypothetical protein
MQAAAAALRRQQTWFAAAVMTPQAEATCAEETEARAMLTAGPRLSALERLEVYRTAYHSRLIECLADDYPALANALGAEAFDTLCRAYIARHPSTGPNLNWFGKAMTPFCRELAPLPSSARPFAAALAGLEWSIVEVIHARTSAPLTSAGMGEIPIERWANARLTLAPALKLLRSDYPVNAYFQAFRDGRQPALPEPATEATVVVRNGPTVWRMGLTSAMFELLHALAAGERLGAALESTAGSLPELDENEAGQLVMGWFREWVACGLFASVDF